MSQIKNAVHKHGFLEEETNEHYLNILYSLPENEWFLPSNKNNEEREVCWWFASHGLICKKHIPIFRDGSYVGMKEWYYWNKELNYFNVV
jgi:hypothetical protein